MAPANQIVKDFTLSRINLIPGAHAVVQRMRGGTPLILARDPADKHDPNAIMVIITMPPARRIKIGYLPVGLAAELAPLMDTGLNIIARKAPNPLYGVCQVAYIPPPPTEAAPVKPEPMDLSEPVELKTPATTPVSIELPPEGGSGDDMRKNATYETLNQQDEEAQENPNVKRAQDFADRTGVSIPDMGIEPKNYRGDGRPPRRNKKDDSDA